MDKEEIGTTADIDKADEEGRFSNPRLVTVTVDQHGHQVIARQYKVKAFKKEVGVSDELALDELVNGQFQPLDDEAKLTIQGGETFISHVRTGDWS